ncbi:MAG: hypothetical protein IJ623_09770 [Bacteroidales bacterium]|nr:hypothetical protein [Bacteroidales bacterium]
MQNKNNFRGEGHILLLAAALLMAAFIVTLIQTFTKNGPFRHDILIIALLSFGAWRSWFKNQAQSATEERMRIERIIRDETRSAKNPDPLALREREYRNRCA